MLSNLVRKLRAKPVFQLLISGSLLMVTNFAQAQPTVKHSDIRQKIEEAFEWKGKVSAVERSNFSASCKPLISLFGPVAGEIARYDFVIKEERTKTLTPMIACIHFHEKGSRSFEYYPASVLKDIDQQS